MPFMLLPDPILATNLILCVVILGPGLWEYRRSGLSLALYVGVAFGLFGISHAIALAGLTAALQYPVIIIRFLAYLLVIDALWMQMRSRRALKT